MRGRPKKRAAREDLKRLYAGLCSVVFELDRFVRSRSLEDFANAVEAALKAGLADELALCAEVYRLDELADRLFEMWRKYASDVSALGAKQFCPWARALAV